MTIFWIAALFLVVGALLGAFFNVRGLLDEDSFYWSGVNIIGMWSGYVVAFLAALMLGIGTLTYTIDKSACAGYAQATGRPTRFRVTSGWGAWDCFTPAHDGRWVPTDSIGDYNK